MRRLYISLTCLVCEVSEAFWYNISAVHLHQNISTNRYDVPLAYVWMEDKIFSRFFFLKNLFPVYWERILVYMFFVFFTLHDRNIIVMYVYTILLALWLVQWFNVSLNFPTNWCSASECHIQVTLFVCQPNWYTEKIT